MKIPTTFMILPEGKIEAIGKEPAFLSEVNAQKIIDRFTKRGVDMVIDYEHQTLSESEAPAAGWISKLWWEKGIKCKVKWTDRAKTYLREKEYRYFSPVFFVKKDNRQIISLYNVALTNVPRLKNIEPLISKQDETSEILVLQQPFMEDEMDPKQRKKLLKLLGRDADASDEDIFAAIKKLASDVEKNKEVIAAKDKAIAEASAKEVIPKEVITALGLEEGTDNQVIVAKIQTLAGMQESSKELVDRIEKQEVMIAKMQAKALIDEATQEGKVTKAELEQWAAKLAETNPEQFKLIVLSRKVGAAVPVEPPKKGKPDAGTLDDVQLSINKTLGISDEQFKKFGGE